MCLNKIEKAELVAELCITTYDKFKNRPAKVRSFVEGIVGAEGIFRVPSTQSGWISKAALAKKEENSSYTPTKEHYFGRKASADKIFEQLEKGKGFDRIRNIILSRSRVHYTTSAENEILKKYGDLPWRQAYAICGIELVPYEGRKVKKVSIDGKIFASVKEVSNEYDIPELTVRYRISSDSKKWVGWKFV